MARITKQAGRHIKVSSSGGINTIRARTNSGGVVGRVVSPGSVRVMNKRTGIGTFSNALFAPGTTKKQIRRSTRKMLVGGIRKQRQANVAAKKSR